MTRTPAARFAVVLTALSLGLAVQPAVAFESEPNDTCLQANPLQGSSFDGTMATGDKDFFSRPASAGDYITLRLWQSTSGVLFHIVLHYPTCTAAAFNYKTSPSCEGCVHETVGFTATASGPWFAEVWTQSGTGFYEGDFFVTSPGESSSCTEAPLVVSSSLGQADSCSVDPPSCPTGTCQYRMTASITGVGQTSVALQGTSASCSGLNGCSDEDTHHGALPASLQCRSEGTEAVGVTFSCEVTLVSF